MQVFSQINLKSPSNIFKSKNTQLEAFIMLQKNLELLLELLSQTSFHWIQSQE